MKASDLRLGNYVYLDGPGEAAKVKPNHLMHFDRIFIYPIELDEIILESLGFNVEWTNGGFLKWEKGDFVILDGRLRHPQFHSPKAVVVYVHQLQNLYYAVTGEELVIEQGDKRPIEELRG